MKTILISGGAGYIGTFLTIQLLKTNIVIVYDEFNFDWLLKNKKKIKNNKRLFLLKKDIGDVEVSDFKDVDIVCDVSGISNDPSSELDSKFTWKVNFYSRTKFAKIAKKAGVKHYIFNSTCAVYGHNDKIVFESSVKKPLSTYAKANLRSETLIYSLKSKTFAVNILRNSTLFGASPTMRLDLVINNFVYNHIERKNIVINGDGKQWRPFVSVQDIANIYTILVSRKAQSFICNLVAFNLKISDLAIKVSKILKIPKENIVYKKDNNDLRNYKISNKKFQKLFAGFKFTSLDKEVLALKKHYIKFKTKRNIRTIRMLFYKKKLS